MAKTAEKFNKAEQARFHALMARISKLEEILLGDQEKTGAPGYEVMLTQALSAATTVIAANKKLIERVRVLEAFLAPAMNGATPPMDGAVVATKAHVDQCLDRLAGALRGEMAVATDRQKRRVAP